MHVLVIEDEQRLSRAIARGLEDHGLTVTVAHDGETGLREGSRDDVDLIVLDLMLPRVSGEQVCRRLRSGGVWTPILVLTAKDGETDEAGVLDLGADDYLRKPFSYLVLVARINALLRRGPVVGSVELTVGDLVLDVVRRTARRGTRRIDLTRREFSLLEFLARHPGQPLAKQEILDNVWDEGPRSDLNLVEVYVGYLRRKIDEPFGYSTLRTVRGLGYVLDAGT
jgi:two-component system, OmpR family, response regulator